MEDFVAHGNISGAEGTTRQTWIILSRWELLYRIVPQTDLWRTHICYTNGSLPGNLGLVIYWMISCWTWNVVPRLPYRNFVMSLFSYTVRYTKENSCHYIWCNDISRGSLYVAIHLVAARRIIFHAVHREISLRKHIRPFICSLWGTS